MPIRETVTQSSHERETDKTSSARRAYSLDALRGLAIVLMCLSGLLPGALPNWMYHGYYPQSLPAALVDPVKTNAGENPVSIVADADQPWGEWQPVPRAYRADWPSLTWVDVVFPMFLFAMGTAIPLALHARRRRGASTLGLLGGAGQRFGLLVGFAIYAQQMSPWFMANPPGAGTWTRGLLAMVPASLILTRLPATWKPAYRWLIRGVGWAGAIGLIVWAQSLSERVFSWNDKDIIILLLAWSSLLVTTVAVLTGGWIGLRLLVILPLAGLAHHQAMRPGWRIFGDHFDAWMPFLQAPKRWLDLSAWSGPLPEAWLNFSGLYDFTWFKFAGIVVLGTLVGDRVLRWQLATSKTQPTRDHRNSRSSRYVNRKWMHDGLLSLLLLAAAVGTLVGLKDCASVLFSLGEWRFSTPYAAVILGVLPAGLACWWVGVSKTKTSTTRNDVVDHEVVTKQEIDQRYLSHLIYGGSSLLAIGVGLSLLPGPRLDTAFAYFEGGIKKGPPSTLSWYVVSTGVSILLLAIGALWMDVRRSPAAVGWLTANGQNPMLAYLGIRNLLAPLISLPLLWWAAEGENSLNHWVRENVTGSEPWALVGWAVCQALALALVVWALTRRRLIWRV